MYPLHVSCLQELTATVLSYDIYYFSYLVNKHLHSLVALVQGLEATQKGIIPHKGGIT